MNRKVSIILLDWSVRESYHSIEYLNKQDNVLREDYEIIWIEYYDKKAKTLLKYNDIGYIDQYIVLGKKGGYRKHVMYNEGILAATGEIIVICDSDAMFSSTFVFSIIDTFNRNDNIVLYLDEIRSKNKCFYPFNYPDWEEVLRSPGCINWDYEQGKTIGLTGNDEVLKAKYGFVGINLRNYGACFCARRDDIIRVGGCDEHETYDGHVCGPYELGWRLVNAGLREVWHQNEFLMHVYHPWIKLDKDVVGPHIRFNSTTALKQKEDGSIYPIVENKKIKHLRTQGREYDREGPVKVSIVTYSKRPYLWDRLCDSISRATKYPYEVILVGPKAPGFARGDAVWIETDVKPSQCYEIGFRAAKGEFICCATDDALYRQGTIDRAIELFNKKNGLRTIIGFRYMETYNKGASWMEGGQYDRVYEDECVARYGMMTKDYFMKLGGYDNRFIESCAELDLCARAWRDGGTVTICDDAWIDVWHESIDLIIPENPRDRETLNSLWHCGDSEKCFEKSERGPVRNYEESNILLRSQGEVGICRYDWKDKFEDRVVKLKNNEMYEALELIFSIDKKIEDGVADSEVVTAAKHAVECISGKIRDGFLEYLCQIGRGVQCVYEFASKLNERNLKKESITIYSLLIDQLPLLLANRSIMETGLSYLPNCYYDMGLIAYENGDYCSAEKYLSQCLLIFPSAPKARRLLDKISKVYLCDEE